MALEFERLVHALLDKTEKGDIKWARVDKSTFGTTAGTVPLQLNNPYGTRFDIAVLNSKGVVVGTYTNSAPTFDPVVTETLKQLYNIARYKADRVQETFADLEKFIG